MSPKDIIPDKWMLALDKSDLDLDRARDGDRDSENEYVDPDRQRFPLLPPSPSFEQAKDSTVQTNMDQFDLADSPKKSDDGLAEKHQKKNHKKNLGQHKEMKDRFIKFQQRKRLSTSTTVKPVSINNFFPTMPRIIYANPRRLNLNGVANLLGNDHGKMVPRTYVERRW